MRTIILSDAHGEPDVVRAVIEHSGFDPDRDRLIFAGDAIEVGRDSAGAIALLEEVGAEFLIGNHEYAVFVDSPLEIEPLDPGVEATVRDRIDNNRWRLAAEAEGVLISHAGVSNVFADEYAAVTEHGTVADFAEHLNRAFRDAIATRGLMRDGVVGADGPLWFRPRDGGSPLRGVVQVAGHTPIAVLHAEGGAEELAARGMYLIDPHVRRWRAGGYTMPPPLRYAVVTDGQVRVVTG